MTVRLFRPEFTPDDLISVKTVFDDAWVGLGSYVNTFEDKWGEEIGSPFCVATNSGTAALHLAVAALKLPPGSKILVPTMTFASTAYAVLYNQLEPIFVDCDYDTMCISIDDLKRKSTQASAVIIVHFGGEACDIEQVQAICSDQKLYLIEDCAHTQGGTLQSKALGTFGHIGCFSFEEKKGMTTGDGGMLVTHDEEIAEYCRKSRWLGIDKDTWRRASTGIANDSRTDWYYEIAQTGYKYNMNNLSAILGLSQLKRLQKIRDRKNEVVTAYQHAFSNLPCQSLIPHLHLGSEITSYWLAGLRTNRRDALREYLKNHDIHTGVHYMPLHHHPLFKKYGQAELATSDRLYSEIVSLPLHSSLSMDEVNHVINNVIDFFEIT